MRANKFLLQKKYARIIELYASREKISLTKALDVFYNSSLYELLRKGISDMHCMSDIYLVEELQDEYHKQKNF